MSETTQDSERPDPIDYEASIRRLEEIVAHLERHDTKLADALGLYEEGVELARSCMQQLRDAELHVSELKWAETDSEESDSQGDRTK